MAKLFIIPEASSASMVSYVKNHKGKNYLVKGFQTGSVRTVEEVVGSVFSTIARSAKDSDLMGRLQGERDVYWLCPNVAVLCLKLSKAESDLILNEMKLDLFFPWIDLMKN